MYLYYLFFIISITGASQRALLGNVLDYNTKMPIEKITVLNLQIKQWTMTDTDGCFSTTTLN
tara:strand:+ start:14431 stop:14616 length:186 start_codon:yes stop_codon:yes gene_type:complete